MCGVCSVQLLPLVAALGAGRPSTFSCGGSCFAGIFPLSFPVKARFRMLRREPRQPPASSSSSASGWANDRLAASSSVRWRCVVAARCATVSRSSASGCNTSSAVTSTAKICEVPPPCWSAAAAVLPPASLARVQDMPVQLRQAEACQRACPVPAAHIHVHVSSTDLDLGLDLRRRKLHRRGQHLTGLWRGSSTPSGSGCDSGVLCLPPAA